MIMCSVWYDGQWAIFWIFEFLYMGWHVAYYSFSQHFPFWNSFFCAILCLKLNNNHDPNTKRQSAIQKEVQFKESFIFYVLLCYKTQIKIRLFLSILSFVRNFFPHNFFLILIHFHYIFFFDFKRFLSLT